MEPYRSRALAGGPPSGPPSGVPVRNLATMSTPSVPGGRVVRAKRRSQRGLARTGAWAGSGRPGAGTVGRLWLLQAVAFSIFAFPSSMVIAPIGAAGTVPLMLAILLFVFWGAAVLFGIQNPLASGSPGRMAFCVLALATCASYAAMFSGWTGGSTVAARAAADRWVLLLVGSAGIILVASQSIKTLDDVMRIVRPLLAGAFVCSVIAVIQFFLRINPVEWIQQLMVGFTYNGGDTAFQVRGTFLRVAGTTFTSIELAVVSAMLLPLSVWRALYDQKGRKWLHWLGTCLLGFSLVSTISRSSVLGLMIIVIVFVPFLPRIARQWSVVVVPIAIALVFLTIPGVVSTLGDALTSGNSDPSISTRTNNYPRVARMIGEQPILGAGPGNFMPEFAIYILDNQYLNSAVTLGLVGMGATIVYLSVPGLATLVAARAATAGVLRCLAGAVAAGTLVATACSLTFDSLSFPVFALTFPMLVGLGCGIWKLVQDERAGHAADGIRGTWT